MVACSFCKKNIPVGTGKMYVFITGKVLYFCSKKCQKNQLQLHRKPAHLKWTGAYEKGVKSKEKEAPKEVKVKEVEDKEE
ncbi:50S ribosomal protein L24e [Candidatus Woesearchaeota archaeon]|nr:50S ribosomal protein L24e [Candidatus Woesearchaeota archaeon]